MNWRMGLGEKIKQARDEAGLTQDDLAYRLRAYTTLSRTSGTQLAKWEKNTVDRLSFYAIEAIAIETNKPLEFFSEPRAAGAATIANDDPSTDSDGHGRADDQATAAEVAGRRHPERGAASTRRSRDSKS